MNLSVDDNGGDFYSFTTYVAVVVFREPLDNDPGWIISGGNWEFGAPEGLGGQFGFPDPVAGSTGMNVYGYNLAGDYENGMPEYNLTTYPIDVSGVTALTLRFHRWLGIERYLQDKSHIDVSVDGENWDLLWRPDSVVTDSEWTEMELDLSPWMAESTRIRIRWNLGPTNQSKTGCGWNIDDVEIFGAAPAGYTSPTPMPTYTPTPTGTPTPEPTPTFTASPSCTRTGVTLSLPASSFTAGETFYLDAMLCNTGTTLSDTPLFVILDVFGALYFAPGWKAFPGQGIDYYLLTIETGNDLLEIIPPFIWPDGAGSADNLRFHAAMTDPEFTLIIGEADSIPFSFY